MNFLKRVLTAAGLLALAVMLGIWLSRLPLTAPAPSAAVKPTLAIPPMPITPADAPATIEVPVEVQIGAPAAKPAEPKPMPRYCGSPHRRGLFGRRR